MVLEDEVDEGDEEDELRKALIASVDSQFAGTDVEYEEAISQSLREEARRSEVAEVEAPAPWGSFAVRAPSLEESLQRGQWSLYRHGGHRVYKRMVITIDGAQQLQEQTITLASTPSDRRARLNELAELRRKDDGSLTIASNQLTPTEVSDASQTALVTITLRSLALSPDLRCAGGLSLQQRRCACGLCSYARDPSESNNIRSDQIIWSPHKHTESPHGCRRGCPTGDAGEA